MIGRDDFPHSNFVAELPKLDGRSIDDQNGKRKLLRDGLVLEVLRQLRGNSFALDLPIAWQQRIQILLKNSPNVQMPQTEGGNHDFISVSKHQVISAIHFAVDPGLVRGRTRLQRHGHPAKSSG